MNREISFKIPEDSIVSKRGLIRTRDVKSQKHKTQNDSMDLDISLTLDPFEIRRLLDTSSLSNTTLNNSRFVADFTQNYEHEKSVFSEYSTKEKTDMLFPQFLEVLQSRTNDSEVFDTVQDLIQTCSGILDDIIKQEKHNNEKYNLGDNIWLQQERDTWKLLYCLYKDRIMIQKEDVDCDGPILGGSEKEVVNQLYSICANLREYQLIVDWLEVCALEKTTREVGHFTDRTVGWENTLFQLQNPRGVAFGNSQEIVQHIDPDAPIREKKPLHPLDIEDDARLTKHIFQLVRQGRIEDAKSLCEYCGQPWRAAILEGWRPHEDPNYETNIVNEKLPIEGNPNRDIWKKCAWMMADSPKFDEYTRAIAGAFCGHLESIVAVLSDSWEDLLWAYLKVQIDIRVETEIRSCCVKSYNKMPDKYWNSKMSLEQIFEELSVHKNMTVRNAASSKICTIQRHLILDNTQELLQFMQTWIEEQKQPPHFLRFLSHIVLFMRQIGKVDKEDVADKIIKAYVECLIEFGDPQLIAFYTAALPGDLQILLYSRYLENVKETAARKAALEEALAAGLDVETITTHTVETIRNKQSDDDFKLLQTEFSVLDQEKISALEWLTFYPQQRGELLWQANAIIRTFLAETKIECVRKAFKMVPADSIGQIISTFGSKDNLPCKEECSIKEYLCHQTYLAAIDGFNDWTTLYHNQPKQPLLAKSDANFTERIASEHKEQAYKAEVDRWKMNLAEQAKITRDLLFNVLLFPDKGWLIDPDTVKEPNEIEQSVWENRLVQLECIRKLCIPEVVLLLHKVLHLSGEYKDCVQLADELSSEQRQLYKVYSKHKLAEILSKIAESSLSLMNEKLDPWGYPATI